MLRCRIIIYLSVVFSFLLVAEVWGLEPTAKSGGNNLFTEKEKLFNSMENSMENSFKNTTSILDSRWDVMEAEEEARWRKLEQEVLQKWESYYPTTKKVWVDYDEDHSSVSRVNFETGEVVVEVLVPVDSTPDHTRQAIGKKLLTLLEEKDEKGDIILDNQINDRDKDAISSGKIVIAIVAPREAKPLNPSVSPEIVKPKIPVLQKNTEIAKKGQLSEVTNPVYEPPSPDHEIVVSTSETISGKDGVKRKKVVVRLALVPDHIQVRANKFLQQVEVEASRYGIDPALILAVIQTESYFNPKARSPVPAFGLMQIVPKYAGRDAHKALYGKDKLLSPEFLYNSDNNIKLGSAYLNLLQQRYFADIEDPVKRRYICVCAYNWGPTAMRKRLLPKLAVDELSAEQLFNRLLEGVPEETRNYLNRVEERRAMYISSRTSAN